jgi:dipeptidyl aminopeptidase/acylaminoacyl peptidase
VRRGERLALASLTASYAAPPVDAPERVLRQTSQADIEDLMRLIAAIALGSLACGCGGAGAERQAAAPAGGLTIDLLTQIKHPSEAVWSPDSRRVAFVWDMGGVQNLYVVDAQASGPPSPLTSYNDGPISDVSWTQDGRALLFVHAGDLWQVSAAAGEQPKPQWTTPAAENDIVFSPDRTRVVFVRGDDRSVPDWQRGEGDLWVRSLANGSETRLTHNEGVVSSPSWSPDGQHLAFTLTPVRRVSEAPEYSGAKILYTRSERGPSSPAFVSAAGGKVTKLSPSPGWDPTPVWLDGSRLLVQRVGEDNRTRELSVTDTRSGQTKLIYREQDPKFWSLAYVASTLAPSPDGRRVAFVSDRDGWDHLYLASTSGGDPVQITHGEFEVRNPSWSSDGSRIAFDRNVPGKPGVRQLAIVSVKDDASKPAIADVTSGRGTNIAPVWSPDGNKVVYQHTDPHTSAELFVADTASRSEQPKRLTKSMPAGVDVTAFVEPELVKYTAPDGGEVPAYVFIPKGLDRSRKHPAIVWVHGDGINQNYDGWHIERNYAVYYSFHQYLLQRGYIVIAPDYRGSIGYGREWREGVYLDVGGKDSRDASAAADYLKTLSFVDADRIGIWGLSYGGFFTLKALTDRPTTYRCGVDVAGVPDFGMWHVDPGGPWVDARMGTPEQHPALYSQAAPIDRIERLSRPLLVLHGTSDVNVPYVESVRLIDRLLETHKEFEFMVYPGEFHYFQRTHVLRDAWERVDGFFARHLMPQSTTASTRN